MGTILDDHSKLDSNTVANAIRPLVETDPSLKVKFIIMEVQSSFNYTISYRKAWLTKYSGILIHALEHFNIMAAFVFENRTRHGERDKTRH
ncbi:hypothetical protein Ahy_B05g079735 [Arachis hypogaea]|uniref:Uncharacterized protein n=1 Tax=Arachis hypogaea TaxID=3818 RepID=A0A444ZAY0_ARAHY|nr:hypothetical protein Ahy_B05g079735 [Arachis hypogaea]